MSLKDKEMPSIIKENGKHKTEQLFIFDIFLNILHINNKVIDKNESIVSIQINRNKASILWKNLPNSINLATKYIDSISSENEINGKSISR